TESKVALVIGNNDYPGSAKLKNAKNDAKDIAFILKNKLGFKVFEG
nr:caspase family protein [Sulfurimonas sp.]